MAAMQLEARDFAARFREMHSVRLRPNLPPLELEQAPATLDDGAADPLGTGSTVWRGGDALARALAVDDALRGAIEGKRVVELGSGTGVAGLACAALGARAVALTDLPERVALLRRNAARNRGHTVGCDVAARPLAWGDRFGALALAADGVDVVVAADVCYRADAVAPLAASIACLMERAAVGIVACERHEPVAYAALKATLAATLDVATHASSDDGRVEILLLRRRAAT